MNEREQTTPAGASPDGSDEDWAAPLQALYQAAYRPLDPSEALRRRVAAIAARHDNRRAWRSVGWRWRPMRERFAAGALAAVLLAALGLTLRQQWRPDRGRSPGDGNEPVGRFSGQREGERSACLGSGPAENGELAA